MTRDVVQACHQCQKGMDTEMMSDYYLYQKQHYHCDHCGWDGLGAETEDGDDLGHSMFEIHCPQCSGHVGYVYHPTLEQILEFGTEEEKAIARERQAFLERFRSSILKSPDQLQDIDADEIIITLREVEEAADGGDAQIILLWQEKEIWREVRAFEYYPRYLELGKILKEKYGDRLVDFEPIYSMHLGGDCMSAFDRVDEFRKTLKLNRTRRMPQ